MSLGVRLMSLGVGWNRTLEMSLEVVLMSLMSLGSFPCAFARRGGALMSLGVRLMSLGVGLEEELGNEFGRDFDEFDEFGGHFLVCLQEDGLRLMSLGVRLMSLGVG